MSGMLILGTFLAIMHNLFLSSVYASLLRPFDGDGEGALLAPSHWSSATCLLHAATCAASFLNVLSHAGVALGVLNDTYVLSILVGVGFDVVTRVLQLVWMIGVTATLLPEPIKWSTIISSVEQRTLHAEDDNLSSNDDLTLEFLLVLVVFYVYHMIVHVRALCMNQSLERLQNVLTSALNNLRGIPGEGYMDHFFAYTDLGTHMLAFGLSALLLKRDGALFVAAGFLVFLVGISFVVLSRIPFPEMEKGLSATNHVNHLASMIQVLDSPQQDNIKTKTITCLCLACKRRKQRQRVHRPVSFTFNADDGICQLWLSSFKELSGILSFATKS